jgi:hypothetical protein
MAKLYFENPNTPKSLSPKKQTVDFILNFSKSYTVINLNDRSYEYYSN